MDKKQHRKRKKVKRLVIAYLLRAVVILIPVIMITQTSHIDLAYAP